jgi:hypothetical protein
MTMSGEVLWERGDLRLVAAGEEIELVTSEGRVSLARDDWFAVLHYAAPVAVYALPHDRDRRGNPAPPWVPKSEPEQADAQTSLGL